ncbi:MAG: YfiR family protein, partial [Thiohalomonadales bacterium]
MSTGNPHIIKLFICATLLLPISKIYATPPVPADKIKAAYIYQFTQFITWPETASARHLPFSLCIIGQEPIGKALEPLNQRLLNGRSMRVFFPKTINETSTCNVLYIAKTEQHQMNAILNFLH